MPTITNRKLTLATAGGDAEGIGFQAGRDAAGGTNAGEMLVESLYVSVDPYMRGRISNAKSYAAAVEIGGVMVGGVVGKVVASNNPRFAVGEIVQGEFGWQTHAISNGKGVRRASTPRSRRFQRRSASSACRG